MGSAMLKEAVYALKIYYYDSEEIVKTVIEFALAAAASAAASGCLPGAGSTVAIAVSLGFVVAMYVALAKMLGVEFGNGILKSIASAVLADLGGAIAAFVIVAAAISFVPGFGTIGAATITGITSFCYVYLAGMVYIKMLGTLLNMGKSVSTMSEEELKQAMKKEMDSLDMREAIKEAKCAYKQNK